MLKSLLSALPILGAAFLLAPAGSSGSPAPGYRPVTAGCAAYLSLPATAAWSSVHAPLRDPGRTSVSQATNGSFCSAAGGTVATRVCTSAGLSTCSVGANPAWSHCSVNTILMGAQCSASSAAGGTGFCSVSAPRAGSHCSTFVATRSCSSISSGGRPAFCSVIPNSGGMCTTFNSTQVRCSAFTVGAQCSVQGQPNSNGPCQ